MLKLILHRLLMSIPLVIVVTGLTFALQLLVPGDAARAILGGDATAQSVSALRTKLGLDQPWYEQYWHWLDRALHGNLGSSVLNGESVTSALGQRLGVTISLMLGVAVVSAIIGIGLGIASAIRGGWLGKLLDALSVAGLALPSFWVALVLVAILSVQLGWLPASGYTSLTASPATWFKDLVMPVAALSLAGVTIMAKQTRDAMMDALGRDYIRSLRASGIGQRSIVFRHALRNAALPLVTVWGIVLIGALTGTVFIESVFVLPGLGSAAQQAVQQHDLPIIQGVALYFTLITIVVNLLVDIAYGWLNPKVRTA